MTQRARSPFLRIALAWWIAGIAGLAPALPAQAQDYPSRPVRIIVPFAAGGSADVYARAIGQRLQEAMGVTFVVENRPGAGSIIGTDAVAKAAPDGYTLLMMSNTHTINESLIPTKPYALMRDFAPIAPVNYSDLLLVARAQLPIKDLPDLIQQAKAKPDGMTYASSGPGTPYHLAGELFKSMAGVSIIHVPYKGSSNARTDVLGGQVDLMFDTITTMVPFVASGRIRVIGTTGDKRSAVLPDVPTIAESGLPGFEATIWLGLMAPRDVPPAIVERLNAEVRKITQDPAVKQAWATQGATSMTMTTGEFKRYLDQDVEKWTRIVRISGAKAGE